MNKLFEYALKQVEETKNAFNESAKILGYLPTDLEARHVYIYEDHVSIVIPYDVQRIKELEDQLIELGWFKISDEISDRYGERWINFDHPEIENRRVLRVWGMLSVNADPAVAGSMCKRQQIGVEEVPIYEITCLQAEPI